MSETKYYRFDAIKIKSGNVGGRMFSAQFSDNSKKSIHNGYIGYLGEYRTGETEIRELLDPTAELIKSEIPVIVHKPETNYKQDSRVDNNIGEFINPEGKPTRVYTLEKYDEGSWSEDYFDLTGKVSGKTTEIEVGDIFTIQAGSTEGSQLKYSTTTPDTTTAKCYFKVTHVENAFIPVYVHSDGKRFPTAYKMVDLEVVFSKEA